MTGKCSQCDKPATKKVIWADGRAFQPSCDAHVKATQDMLTKKNGEMTELAGVQDLTDSIDLVASAAYPDLERKPGGPDNWVERAGGLPSYIERIAKHLHYERGFRISHAIATAVNTVKRWALGGTVTKYGTTKTITPKTQALAAAAVASWEAKKKAGSVNLTEAELRIIDLTMVGDDMAHDLLDLADADISATTTMVALMLPEGMASALAVEDGVPPEDLHVTVTFHGELDDAGLEDLKRVVSNLAREWQGEPLKGSIGGIGMFAPASDEGFPCYAPVDVPGLNTLHEQVASVSGNAANDHGYTPHMTLAYVEDQDDMPDMVEPTPVEFASVWVVRGGEERYEYRLGSATGVDEPDHGMLSADEVELTEGLMDIRALAERANQIEDPEARGIARARVLDLASTIAPRHARGKAKDGRNSFSGQGRFRHGFIPVNKAAKEAKAKGSPIAMKRMKRLFGKDTAPDDAKNTGPTPPSPSPIPSKVAAAKYDGEDAKTPRTRRSSPPPQRVKAATGRAGQRTAPNKANPDKIKVDEKSHPGSEGVQDIGQLRHTPIDDPTQDKNRVTDSESSSQMEASKESRTPERARQNWDEIPEALKTVRNGKKYVLAEYGGKQFVTEWVGGINETESTPLAQRKVMSSLTTQDAANMAPAALRSIVNNPKIPEAVKVKARKALRVNAEKGD